MKFFLNGTWVNDNTIKVLPDGAVALTDAEWNDRQNIPYEPTQAELDATHNKKVDADLKEIDEQSIRPLREYVSAQTDAPQFIKDRESEAVLKRGERRAL